MNDGPEYVSFQDLNNKDFNNKYYIVEAMTNKESSVIQKFPVMDYCAGEFNVSIFVAEILYKK